MSLSHDDVQRIVRLLDASQFDELRLEAEGIKLHLVRHGAGSASVLATAPAAVAQPAAVTATAVTRHAASPAAAKPVAPAVAAAAGLHDIRAPMLGTFYCAPKPGAAPFVSVGSRVEPDGPVGVIEVMKLMNAISAHVGGEVVEVLVADGELVEFDQVLMRVQAPA